MIASIIVLIVVGALYFAWRNKKANAPKPPEWTNAGEPPADRPDPANRSKSGLDIGYVIGGAAGFMLNGPLGPLLGMAGSHDIIGECVDPTALTREPIPPH